MATSDILYTDGHDVTVTSSKLEIKGLTYWLSAIQRHSLTVVKRDRVGGIMAVFLGMAFILFGLLLLITPPANSEITIAGMLVNPGVICLAAGVLVLALAALLNAVLKEKFAVRIFTDLGQTDVIVSSEKEYITKIVNALDQAFMIVDSKRTKQGQASYL